MEVKISREINEKLKDASEKLGFNENEIVERAVLIYLDMIKKQIDLSKEFKDWDKLSDEAIVNFENSL